MRWLARIVPNVAARATLCTRCRCTIPARRPYHLIAGDAVCELCRRPDEQPTDEPRRSA